MVARRGACATITSTTMRSLPGLVLLALVLSACQELPFSLESLEVSSGEVLFQDDFSDPGSGWDRISQQPSGALAYEDGSYRIFVSESYRMLWASPGLNFVDVRIEVDATSLTALQDDNFGVISPAKDKDNFYFLVISSDGYYGIGKVKQGVQSLIGIPAMLPSESIYQGQTANHLGADCIGDRLNLYANGVLLASVHDAELHSGEVGLIAGTFENPGTEVYFDNFTVLKP